MAHAEAYDFSRSEILRVVDGYVFRFNGTCIGKLNSSGDLIIKGSILTNEPDPCAL